MHRRSLGSTGLNVSVLGIGSSPFRHGTAKEGSELLAQALDLGITYYDTARSYINGEEAVAELSPAISERLVVATKTGARGGRYCLQDLQRSLRTMRRKWIDVWMTHMIKTPEEYEQCTMVGGFCDVAVAARQAGLVRASGASFHAPTNLILRAIEEGAFDVVMFQLNLIGRETIFGSGIASYRETLLPAARTRGVGVVVMKVLAGGELPHASKLAFASDPGTGRNAVGGAVRYATMHPDIGTAVVGMANVREVMANVLAVEGVDDQQLPEFLHWTKLAEQMNKGECTRCGACLGVCPEGIEIPKILRLHDQQRFFGMERFARQKYSMLDIDASACTRCRKCQEVCPEGFDIGISLDSAHSALTQPLVRVRETAAQ